jgi:hypothetical protein
MSTPDANTWLVIIFGLAGWSWNFVKMLGFKSWQHKAMWREYCERHDLPLNGGR